MNLVMRALLWCEAAAAQSPSEHSPKPCQARSRRAGSLALSVSLSPPRASSCRNRHMVIHHNTLMESPRGDPPRACHSALVINRLDRCTAQLHSGAAHQLQHRHQRVNIIIIVPHHRRVPASPSSNTRRRLVDGSWEDCCPR